MAVYDAEELDHAAWVNYTAGHVYIREVPPPLMVTCSLSHIESQDFEAIFTTMAGVPLLRIPRVSNPSSSMEQLAADAACAAVAQGRLQSRNREVCTLLEGQTEPLGILTVSDFLWDKLTKPRDAAERYGARRAPFEGIRKRSGCVHAPASSPCCSSNPTLCLNAEQKQRSMCALDS
jgi:hypothetical protein